MKPYLFSLAAGLLVGVVYSLLTVRSPAPPVIALIGLFGILLGEQAVPLVKRALAKEAVTMGWVREQCGAHVFGELPAASPRATDSKPARSQG
ncbi:MAG: XapX domain-containing protein [Vitreimonas sp.]